MEVALHLNKLEFPSPKNVFCQVWLKLTPCFYEKGEQTDEWTGDQKNSPSFQLSWAKIEWVFVIGIRNPWFLITDPFQLD